MATTKAELEARIKDLEAKLEAGNNGNVVSYKVSQRGAVSVYGLGRFPVTLYQSQWARLLAHQEELKQFMTANAHQLAAKKS
jgi:hypothetical protein